MGSAFVLLCIFGVEWQLLAGQEADTWQLTWLVCMLWVAIDAAQHSHAASTVAKQTSDQQSCPTPYPPASLLPPTCKSVMPAHCPAAQTPGPVAPALPLLEPLLVPLLELHRVPQHPETEDPSRNNTSPLPEATQLLPPFSDSPRAQRTPWPSKAPSAQSLAVHARSPCIPSVLLLQLLLAPLLELRLLGQKVLHVGLRVPLALPAGLVLRAVLCLDAGHHVVHHGALAGKLLLQGGWAKGMGRMMQPAPEGSTPAAGHGQEVLLIVTMHLSVLGRELWQGLWGMSTGPGRDDHGTERGRSPSWQAGPCRLRVSM